MRLVWIIVFLFSVNAFCNEPDSAYIFSYATDKNSNKNGLHFAWSINQHEWHPIGPEYSYLRCDYGNWGSEKKMFSPVLVLDSENTWHCIWSLNNNDGALAHSESKDLIEWGRQSYPEVVANNNFLEPEISYNISTKEYLISWISNLKGETLIYSTITKNFKDYSPAKEISAKSRINQRKEVLVSGKKEKGFITKVSWNVVDELIKAHQSGSYRAHLNSENTSNDSALFGSIENLNATISIDVNKSKKISNLLIGAFFEDINYAADGGLYAELIQNRDFEYDPEDKKETDPTWNCTKAWSLKGETATMSIDTSEPIHPNNKHYAVIKIKNTGAVLSNEGFDGIALKAGEQYNFSIFVRAIEGKTGKLEIRLVGKDGEIYGETETTPVSSIWKKYEAKIISKKTVPDAHLEVIPQMTGSVAMDMISLFPQNTFKGRKNGLRTDLAQTIADISPRFVRFPGGCVAHGDGIGNIYQWKNTIGPPESRKPQRNLWGYHQTAGLGYFEYFQFCEDIGAEPLPVIAAAVPCQNSSTGGQGQQGGIPMCEMEEYVQDILDLIEYANGSEKTKWGKIRAEAGHPKPFNLKYVGIGNEDLITDIFEERFTYIYNIVNEKHPEITLIGTVGPFSEGADYREGWKIAEKLNIPIVDEHYYQAPGWFINNQDFYDKYDRSRSKVYLGEYASWGNNLFNALAEALYLTSIERNGDVVCMTSYAPLLAKEGNTQWRTDLIFFNNTEVKPTVNYYVQQLYGQNSGDEYIPCNITVSNNRNNLTKRIAVSVVRDSENNRVIVKLVNILPVAMSSTINLKDLNISGSDAEVTILKGEPDERNIKPEKKLVPVSQDFQVELPPYSFSVYSIKLK